MLLLCFCFCRPLALGNTADAVEILSAGYILNAFKQEDGSPLSSTQKGKFEFCLPRLSWPHQEIEIENDIRLVKFQGLIETKATEGGYRNP